MINTKICAALYSFAALLLFGFAGHACAQQLSKSEMINEPRSPRNANYTMNVRLDVDTRIISGTEMLTWQNTTSHSTDEMQFHLYYNAWRNDRSSYLNSGRYLTRNGLSDYRENDWAYCDVNSMRIRGEYGFQETDVTGEMEFIHPDDDNEEDRTVLRISLPEPVGPGGTISLEIQWESKVPRTFSRTGARDDYFFLAQWFPKVGVFEESGEWNCHQFIQTEFFADFGVYDAQLTVPAGWIVGATGREYDRVENSDGTSTHSYYQEDVHDFAWVTTPHFLVYNERFEEAGLPPVEMRLLLMPDHADKRERYFSSTGYGLKYYGTWFGAYPYDHVTIVDPAYRSGSGGMEYPTFFTGGTRWLSPVETRSPESVTIHEFGHQIWFGVVANNEFEHAYIDEGFNTYSETRTQKEVYPPRVLSRRYLEGFIPIVFSSVPIAEDLEGADPDYGFQSTLKRDPMAQISWKSGPGSYGLNSYDKPAMMLRTLENYFGWETFQKIMSAFYEQWKFKHPNMEDFIVIVNEMSGRDMNWFFNEAFYGSNVFDYAVGTVSSKPVASPSGYREEGGELVVSYGAGEDEGGETLYRSSVFARRWGEAVFPVQVKITFSDGETALEEWDGRDRWTRFDYMKSARVEQVEIDPDHILVLDFNYSNNSWVREPETDLAAAKWTSKWMIWLQNLFEFFSFFS
ncbi:M1 family metallopeptidase [candidate division KSB1 bacterium]